jgi:ADP-ribose pyrophosphatase YjhB (NUDIX family)
LWCGNRKDNVTCHFLLSFRKFQKKLTRIGKITMPESLGASVVVIQAESILLILREDFPVWGLPGGAVETGESVAEAAIREVSEETGVEIGIDRLVGIYNHQQGHQVLFLAHACAGEPRPDGHETLKAEWLPLSHLPERLIGWHRLYIQDALENKPPVVRRINMTSPLSQLTRQEIYDLKDQGKLNVSAMVAEICAPIDKQNIRDFWAG